MLKTTDSREFLRMWRSFSSTELRPFKVWSKAGWGLVQLVNTSSHSELTIVQYAILVFSWWTITLVRLNQNNHDIAWVNNCLGLENYRYYLLALLYLLMGLSYNVFTIMSIWTHHSYKQNFALMNFILVTDGFLIIVLFVMNCFNWFLALSGWSTIELWSGQRVSVLYFYANLNECINIRILWRND